MTSVWQFAILLSAAVGLQAVALSPSVSERTISGLTSKKTTSEADVAKLAKKTISGLTPKRTISGLMPKRTISGLSHNKTTSGLSPKRTISALSPKKTIGGARASSSHPTYAAACFECKTFAGDGGGCSAGSCDGGYCWCPKMLQPLGTGGGAGRNPPQPRETSELASEIASMASAHSAVNCAGYTKCPKEVLLGPS